MKLTGKRQHLFSPTLRRLSVVLLAVAVALTGLRAVGIAQAQTPVPLAGPGLQLFPALFPLLGLDRPHTYLLLVQNNHELRGTGGFITGVGLITLDRARLSGLTLSDSHLVDNHRVDHPPAPPPLRRYMGSSLLFLRDVNWSPDLPTTARLAQVLYARNHGVVVDGVITLDLRAVELLVQALAPVTIPGVEEPLTGQNLMGLIKSLWANPLGGTSVMGNQNEWVFERKDFIPTLARALLEKVRSGRVNYFALFRTVTQALDERAIQVWIADPAIAARLASLGWDGALHPAPGADFLALVDSNLGFNKVDAVLARSVDYRVTWPDGVGGPALAVASITYRHPVNLPDHVCDQTPRYIDRYDEMAERCYFDYVRLYVPGGSELVQVDGVEPDSVSDGHGEAGTRFFAGYFVLKPGQQHSVTFTYRLPPGLTRASYRLVVQRQSGSAPLPLRWSVDGEAWQFTLHGGRLEWSVE